MPKGTFGTLLRQERKELSLTQRPLANRLGVRPSYVAALEAGHRNPSLTTLQRVAEIFDLDAQKLFLLSHPAEAQFFLESRDKRKPVESAWQRFAGNKALRARERVSPAELRILGEISRLGRVSSERQLLFVLRSIRLAFEKDRQRW